MWKFATPEKRSPSSRAKNKTVSPRCFHDLPGERVFHGLSKFLGREGFLEKMIWPHGKTPCVMIGEAGGHQDLQHGMEGDALLEKWLNAHRGIVKVRDQQGWFFLG